ncbi:hypothetical protein WJX81_001447 [Elliptochloris bilobata]|uniref:Ubiquitin-like domain-containing protein n=1 Tax=Elliptochloris bilobata TaxID=381761 RepID=A0AAW1QIX1_9CHLO
MTVDAEETVRVEVRVMFGDNVIGSGGDTAVRRIVLRKDGTDTLLAVKGKIAAAFGGAVVPEHLLLFFGPNARRVGSQYVGDPAGEDATLCLADFSALAWLARFPQWRLGVRMLPEAPPPPGVAEHRAAALAEKKDPEKAVQEARAKGEIPTIMELPAPWGPKPYVKDPNSGFSPAKYPADSSPLLYASTAAA